MVFIQCTNISCCQFILPATASALSRETLILWETWSPAIYCSYSAIIWEMSKGWSSKQGILTSYTSPTFETLICSWKLYFDCPFLSAKDLILYMTTVLKLRPVRANSAWHLCKVLNLLKAYSSIWKHLSMLKIDCKTNFPGADAEEKYCIKFVLPAAHYNV